MAVATSFYGTKIVTRGHHHGINAIHDALVVGCGTEGFNFSDVNSLFEFLSKIFTLNFPIFQVSHWTSHLTDNPAVRIVITEDAHDHFHGALLGRHMVSNSHFPCLSHDFKAGVDEVSAHGVGGLELHGQLMVVLEGIRLVNQCNG